MFVRKCGIPKIDENGWFLIPFPLEIAPKIVATFRQILLSAPEVLAVIAMLSVPPPFSRPRYAQKATGVMSVGLRYNTAQIIHQASVRLLEGH